MENITEENVSLGDLFSKLRRSFYFLRKQWWKVVIAGVLGAIVGSMYATMKPTTYMARLSFFVEEGKAAGGLSSLAGQFGFDLSSLAGGNNGILSADNVTFFLKSTSLNEQTLLTPYDSAGKLSLADRYAEVNNLRNKWRNDKRIKTDVFFPINGANHFSRLQDSLLQVLISQIIKKDLDVSKPDRKASFVEVSTKMQDELLSKYYCERLVASALERYVTVKTERQIKNVSRLQRRADSLYSLLNQKTYSSAAAQGRLLDINPAFQATTASAAEVVGRDKMMLGTIYAEVVKNLEIGKVALSQETPVMQIIDNVELPLKKNYLPVWLAAVAGSIVLLILTAGGIVFFHLLK